METTFEVFLQLNHGHEHPKTYYFIPRLGDTLKIGDKKYTVTKVTALERGQYNNYAAAINANLLE